MNNFLIPLLVVVSILFLLLLIVVVYLLFRKNSSKDKYEGLFNRIEKDNERLRSELNREREGNNQEFKKQHEMILLLEKKISKLHNQIIMLESAQSNHPFPTWLKDTEGTMLFLNEAYENIFLQPQGLSAADYIGNNDFDIWPEDVAKNYKLHDRHVMKAGKPVEFLEKIVSKDGSINEMWRILKFPRYSNRTLVGIAGMAIPEHNNSATSNLFFKVKSEIIKENGLDVSFELIKTFLLSHPNKSSHLQKLTVIEASYRDLEGEKLMGALNSKDYNIEISKIRNSVLQLANLIDNTQTLKNAKNNF